MYPFGDYLNNKKLSKDFTENSLLELNVEDLKALHSLYIKDLFKDRIAPIVPFNYNLILDSFNLSDIKEKSEFLKKWGSEGGIYIIEYILNLSIYYIGKTTLFERRINNHIKAETKSKFQVFLN